MVLLPEPDEQEWTLDCLGLLVRRMGAEALARPSLDPRRLTSRSTHGGVEAARRVLERGAAYLGWEDLDLDVVEEGGRGPRGYARLFFHAPGTLTVAVQPERDGTPETRAVALCRVLTRYWRERAGIASGERRREGRLTDLSAIWLGFGAVLANAAEPAFMDDYGLPAAGSELALQAACYALAARVVARESGCMATWRLGRRLERPARAVFVESLRRLRHPRGALAQRLGLHGRSRLAARRPSSDRVYRVNLALPVDEED